MLADRTASLLHAVRRGLMDGREGTVVTSDNDELTVVCLVEN